ncbi:MAG: hypothetical protein ACE5OT_05185 [Candidatus Hadarchaeaceae archaeon]
MFGTEKQWPIKIQLVNPRAPFMLKDSLIIAADCTLAANPKLSSRFGKDETVVIACPMLEDSDGVASKIDQIIGESKAKKIEVYTMEVPCCHPIHMMVDRSMREKRKKGLEVKNYIVRVMTRKAEPWTPGKVDMSMIEMERKVHAMHHGEEHHR